MIREIVNRNPKLAGIGVERLRVHLAEFEAGQTDGWPTGRITYFTNNRNAIIKFIGQCSRRSTRERERKSFDRAQRVPTSGDLHAQRQDHSSLLDIGPVQIDWTIKEPWRFGRLGHRWRTLYPYLFDVVPEWDRALFTNQIVPDGTHFPEWLGALELHSITGFHGLNQKYQCKRHKIKRQKLEWLCLPDGLRDLLNKRDNGAMFPDLLMYHPQDPAKWFFCEVKGPRDSLKQNQRRLFEQIATTALKPVYLLWIREQHTKPLSEPVCEIAPRLNVR